jgi:hypothetical protein
VTTNSVNLSSVDDLEAYPRWPIGVQSTTAHAEGCREASLFHGVSVPVHRVYLGAQAPRSTRNEPMVVESCAGPSVRGGQAPTTVPLQMCRAMLVYVVGTP